MAASVAQIPMLLKHSLTWLDSSAAGAVIFAKDSLGDYRHLASPRYGINMTHNWQTIDLVFSRQLQAPPTSKTQLQKQLHQMRYHEIHDQWILYKNSHEI